MTAPVMRFPTASTQMLDRAFERPLSYCEYYGLAEPPFSLTPDPRFAYSAGSHQRALETVVHALSRREGLIVVTGEIGCGKTTLCRRLVPLLPERRFLSLVLNPFLTAEDLLKQMLHDFGVVSTDEVRRGHIARTSCHDLARTLQEFLGSLTSINGTAVVIVDEAQNLPIRTLEQIRLLSNFETDTTKLLQIILVGQRNLEPILELEELRQLNQRVSRRCRIEPLSASEVGAYVEHRLTTAAGPSDTTRVKFKPDALTLVWRLSDGVPRLINLLCDRALEFGFAGRASSIDSRLVMEAAQDLELRVPIPARFAALVSRPVTRAAVIAGLIAGVGAVAVAQRDALWPAQVQSAPAMTHPPARPSPVAAIPAPVQAPVVEPAAPPVPLEAAVSFELTVASFETITRARSVATDLLEKGYPARVAPSSSGRWQMVVVGPYSSLAEAMQVKDVLGNAGFGDIRLAQVR